MNTGYLIGYVVLCLVLLGAINVAMRSKQKKRASVRAPEPAVQQAMTVLQTDDQHEPMAESTQEPTVERVETSTDAVLEEQDDVMQEAFAIHEEVPSAEHSSLPPRAKRHKSSEPALADLPPSPPSSSVVNAEDVSPKEEKQNEMEVASADVSLPPEPPSVSVANDQQAVATTAAASSDGHSGIHIGRLLTVLLLGAFVAILNQTLINVALPHMMNDLNVSANVIQWLVTGYMLVNGVLIPITAFLIERFGARKLFIAAMILFTLGAVICAISSNFSIMLFGRLVQASGAGIIMPLMMTVFLTVFPPEKRGRAMGLMGVAIIFAPAIGPTLSGWIVQNYSWRILFYLVIPIGLLDLGLAFAWMKDIAKTTRPKFDTAGFVFSTLGFGGVLYAFSEAGSQGWASAEVILTLFIGIISLGLFIWRELTAEQPMLDLRVFKFDVFTLTTIISAFVNMAMFAAMILLPIYLQNIRGFTPLQAGLLMLPAALLMGVMSPISGAIFDKIGARLLGVVGLLVTVWTTYEFTKLTSDTTYGHILMLYCLRMFGMSLLMMPIQTAGMNQLPRKYQAHGTAMGNTTRQVAGSLGTALLVTIMTNRATFHMANYANEITSANPILTQHMSSLGSGLAAATGLPTQYASTISTQLIYGLAMKEATINGINDAFLYATGFAIVALILAFFIKTVKPAEGLPTKK